MESVNRRTDNNNLQNSTHTTTDRVTRPTNQNMLFVMTTMLNIKSE